MGMKVKGLLTGTAALACAALAACGTATATTGAHSSAAVRRSLASAGGSPQQQARADAAAMLAAFVPPPGASRLSSPPGDVGGRLDGPEFTMASPKADDASLWQVPGMTQLQVLAWERARLPGQYKLGFVSGEAAPHAPSLPGWYGYASDGYDLPAIPGVLRERELLVQAVRSPAGQTYVRVDALAYWIPVRSAAERVPAGVSVITITRVQDTTGPSAPPLATVTDPARVHAIIALVNGLGLDTYGLSFGCPPGLIKPVGADPGRAAASAIRLSFLARAGGPALATVTGGPDPTGLCTGGIAFEIGGTPQPPLASSTPFTMNVLKIAGVS